MKYQEILLHTLNSTEHASWLQPDKECPDRLVGCAYRDTVFVEINDTLIGGAVRHLSPGDERLHVRLQVGSGFREGAVAHYVRNAWAPLRTGPVHKSEALARERSNQLRVTTTSCKAEACVCFDGAVRVNAVEILLLT
eukprot:508336-Prorocentrum_minimum.AAC.1